MSTVTVVGLGKIGLPLAVAAAEAGHRVVGADIDPSVVSTVNRGCPPFPNEAGLDARLSAVRAAGTLEATTDTAAAVSESSAVVVVVPLLTDAHGKPDFTSIDAATEVVGRAMRPDTLVSYETTLPVGTTRGRFAPTLERTSGLTPGVDLFVAHSPERVSSGRVFADLCRYPKLVGGLDPGSAARAVSFYESFLTFDDRPDLDRPNGVWDLGSAEAAELAKLAETTYRDLNIAFANELAAGAERLGIDLGPVIEACNSQPYSHLHHPGVAVGGHCIPVYPDFLATSVPEVTLARAGRLVNEAAPRRAVERIEREFGGLSGVRVVILGAAYRGNVKEHARSGVFALVDELTRRRATVTVEDPLYRPEELVALGLEPHPPGDAVEVVVLQADHDEYRSLGSTAFPGVRLVYDGRRCLDPIRWEGVRLLAPGRP